MAVRRESKIIQCHPRDEQNEVDFMQRFYWNLQSTQTIHVVDNHLETRGENLYSVSKQLGYIKLHFSRDIDTPHLDKIRRLENEYSLLPIPKFPKAFPGGVILWICLVVFSIGFIVPLWVLYFVFGYMLKKPRAQRQYEQYQITRHEIMERLEHIENLPVDEDKNPGQEIKPLMKSATAK